MARLWRSLLLCLCALILWNEGVHATVAATGLDPDDAMLFDVRLSRLRMGEGVRGYRLQGGFCVSFADVNSALDVAVSFDSTRNVAEGWVFEERNLIKIDRAGGHVQYRGRSEALAPDVIMDIDGGWCVETTALARWLDLTIEVDPLNALLLVRSGKPLPVQSAIERKAREEALAANSGSAEDGDPDNTPAPNVALPYRLWRTPSADVTMGMARDNGHLGASYEIFAAGELAWMSAEARIAAQGLTQKPGTRLRLYRSDPDARIFGPLHASEVAIGKTGGFSTGLVSTSREGRGFSLTNRPLDQAVRFNTTNFRGDLPLGWDAELFRNGELIAINRGESGRYAFLDVPLLYGTNRFEIVRFGPQGQQRRERHVYEVGAKAVPPGKWRWWMAALQDDPLSSIDPARHWRYGGGAEVGLDLKTAAALSFQTLMTETGRQHFVELELRRSVGPFGVALDSASNLRQARAFSFNLLGQAAGFRLSGTAMWNRGLTSEQVNAHSRMILGTALDRTMTLGGLLLPLHFDLQQLKNDDGSRSQAVGARISYSGSVLAATLSARTTRDAAARTPYGPAQTTLNLLLSARRGQFNLRGEAGYAIGNLSGWQSSRLTGEWTRNEREMVQTGIAYDWQSREGSLLAGYSRRFSAFSLSADSCISTRNKLSGRINLLFSIGPDGKGRLGRISADRLASTGSVAVSVYRDDDGDGKRGTNEPLMPDATVRIANVRLTKDPQNREDKAMISGLPTATPVSVAIDTASLIDPLLEPEVPFVRIVPRKGLAMTVEMGVVATGIIEGQLVYSDGSEAGNIPLKLRDAQGRLIASTVSDFDGSFLFEKIRYGRYALDIDKPGVRLSTRGASNSLLVIDYNRSEIRVGSVTVERAPRLALTAR